MKELFRPKRYSDGSDLDVEDGCLANATQLLNEGRDKPAADQVAMAQVATAYALTGLLFHFAYQSTEVESK